MAIIQIPAQLGTFLRDARLQQGMTLADVARQLGVSVQAVSKLEKTADHASFARVHRLCLLLGLEIVLQPKSAGVAETAAGW